MNFSIPKTKTIYKKEENEKYNNEKRKAVRKISVETTRSVVLKQGKYCYNKREWKRNRMRKQQKE